jgi:ATP-dependent protease ClpP protease subunit
MNKLNQQVFPIQDDSQEWDEMQQSRTKLRVRFSDMIEEPEKYDKMLSRISDLDESDEIELVLNTTGGSLEGCLAIIDAIRRTDAHVHISVPNRAYSAGSAILMWADSADIGPYSRVMIHAYSGGHVGKSNEIEADFEFNRDFIHSFFIETYSGFLSDDEIQSVFKGEDLWFSAEEIKDRLTKRFEFVRENFYSVEEECCEDCDCSDESYDYCTCCNQCEDTENESLGEFDEDFGDYPSKYALNKPKKNKK